MPRFEQEYTPRPGIVADRLRAARDFRVGGKLFEACIALCYARNIRLHGRETGDNDFPPSARFDELSSRIWAKQYPSRSSVGI